MNKKILVLGASGMLGNAIYRYLFSKPDLIVFGTLRNTDNVKYFSEFMHDNLLLNVDFLNQDDVIRLLKKIQPDVIVNCIGLIKQLSGAQDPLRMLPINSLLPHRLADFSELINAKLIHISTDCVFSGGKGNYIETDICDAADLYGTSKRLGELCDNPHAITLRTSIIGRELKSNYALIDWFLSQKNTIKGYKRAIYSGLPTVELARIIYEYVLPNPQLFGLYHVSSNPIDKYSLLTLAAEAYDKKIEIIPDETFTVDRSLNSARFQSATGYTPPEWPSLILEMKKFN